MWNFKDYSNNIAIIDDCGNQLTYSQLEQYGNEIISNIKNRELVFLLSSNEIGSLIGYSAFINNRIVPILLNANMDKELLSNLINKYKPMYIWSPSKMNDELSRDGNVVFSSFNYSLIKTKSGIEHKLFDELCLLLTTSGSTGSPKFVRQSYENVKANLDSIVEYLNIKSDERPITTLPMNYTYGLSIINSHLSVGATLLLTNKSILQKDFWVFFNNEKATSIAGVPYTYEMLDRMRFYNLDLPSLRYMTQAGGKLSFELHKKIATYALNKGIKFFVMYGQCEATARMGYLPPEKSLERCGSMGIAIPGGEFSLVDSKETIITEPFVTGELVYKGKNVTLGYAECIEDLAKGNERGYVLRTGDMAHFDEEGYYYIDGRLKRFLKIYGNRVNLDEIEKIVKSELGNVDFACSGIDDKMYLFVTDNNIEKKVKNIIVKTTKLNPQAFIAMTINEIPKNDAGKTLYKELSKYFGD